MYTSAAILGCLACLVEASLEHGHLFRESSTKLRPSHGEAVSPLRPLALLFSAANPSSAFHMLSDARLSTARPVVKARAAPPRALALPPQTVQALALNTAIATVGQLKGQKMLTPSGLVHSWALGCMLWGSLGWRGWSYGTVYLLGGSRVTKIGKKKKERLGIAEGRGGRRGPENVWGAAATAAACALASARWTAHAELLRVGFVAAFATKLSDTCGSEIGKAYGKTTYKITTLKPCPPGTEGGVSLEGTIAGIIGSILLSAYAVAIGIVSRAALLPSVIAAFVATNCESLIGAAAQDKVSWLTNEVVNFILTVIGAATGIGIYKALF